MFDIFTKLKKYSNSDYVPMHMPGHKRNIIEFELCNPYEIDITEIEGFDNLHNPTGLLKESMDSAAKLYGADNTFYLVNGSSCGLLSAISAVTQRGDKVLVARNSHKSVYNAIYMNELTPVYIYPQNVDRLGINSHICVQDVEKILNSYSLDINKKSKKAANLNSDKDLNKKNDISAIIITSPTYEGIISDIKSIAIIAHRYNIPLIVDEAHGAHFRYSAAFPQSALELGADIVVQSIHKTLPAFTQTALLHVKSNIVDINVIKRYLDIYQTTSPSYVLMSGIDNCMNILSQKGNSLFSEYTEKLSKLRADISKLKHIRLYEADDISKIVIYWINDTGEYLNGKQLYDILNEEYHIQLEMASRYYVIAMTAVGDTSKYYERFLNALIEIDKRDLYRGVLQVKQKIRDEQSMQDKSDIEAGVQYKAEIVMTPYKAMTSENIAVELIKAAGCISAGCIIIYPPGIPIVFPGEVITSTVIEQIKDAKRSELEIIGLEDGDKILCLK